MKLIKNKISLIFVVLCITALGTYYFYSNRVDSDQPKEYASTQTASELDSSGTEQVNLTSDESDDGQVPLKFSYILNGEEKTYINESLTCLDYKLPEANYYDFDKDGNSEILVQCYAGSGSASNGFYHIGGSNLFVYSVNESGLSEIANFWNERGFEWQVQDLNGDNYLDVIVGDFYDCGNDIDHKICQEQMAWTIRPVKQIWNHGEKNFTTID